MVVTNLKILIKAKSSKLSLKIKLIEDKVRGKNNFYVGKTIFIFLHIHSKRNYNKKISHLFTCIFVVVVVTAVVGFHLITSFSSEIEFVAYCRL